MPRWNKINRKEHESATDGRCLAGYRLRTAVKWENDQVADPGGASRNLVL